MYKQKYNDDLSFYHSQDQRSPAHKSFHQDVSYLDTLGFQIDNPNSDFLSRGLAKYLKLEKLVLHYDKDMLFHLEEYLYVHKKDFSNFC